MSPESSMARGCELADDITARFPDVAIMDLPALLEIELRLLPGGAGAGINICGAYIPALRRIEVYLDGVNRMACLLGIAAEEMLPAAVAHELFHALCGGGVPCPQEETSAMAFAATLADLPLKMLTGDDSWRSVGGLICC